MHGRGKYAWADGRKYEGEYLNDKKHGFGVYTWPDGRMYQGFWENGKQEGKAKYIGVDGNSKWGTWREGKRIDWIPPQSEDKIFKYRDGSPVILDSLFKTQ